MKPFLSAIALAFLMVLSVFSEPQSGRIITITAGTAIRLATQPTKASSILIQVQPSATPGVVYVLNSNPQATCAKDQPGTTLVATLAAGTAAEPGGSFTFPSNGSSSTQAGGSDVDYWCIDGATSGSTVAVSWDVRR